MCHVDVKMIAPFFLCFTFHPPPLTADAKIGVPFQRPSIPLRLPRPTQEGERKTERKGYFVIKRQNRLR